MGGGAKSKVWCEIKSEVLNKTVVTLKENETACLGSAMFAGVGIGAFNSVEEAAEKIVATNKVYKVETDDYKDIYADYKLAEKKLMQIFR